MAHLETRPLKASDFAFCWSVYAKQIRPAIEPLLSRPWVDAEEEARFRTIWTTENAHLIVCDDKPVGWLSFRETPDSVFLEHGYLIDTHQRKRIGSILVNFITAEAHKRGKHVRVETLQGSHAKTFFEKNGFAVTGGTQTAIAMARMA